MKPARNFDDLAELVALLRKECPWDRRQTHDSIKDNLIEEAYEVVEAIDNRDPDELRKELGDLLLQVLFHSRMAAEAGSFTIADVIEEISDKLIRRHPHIFGDHKVGNEKEVAENWETIKLSEGKNSILDGLPDRLPALIRASRMQEKASSIGFDWAEWELAFRKLDEEIAEWKEAIGSGNEEAYREEFGDLLFSIVNVGRLLNIDAEDALRKTNKKFENRFRHIEKRLRENNIAFRDATLEVMDRFWEEAKKEE